MQMRVTTRLRRAKQLGDTEFDDGAPCLTICLDRVDRPLVGPAERLPIGRVDRLEDESRGGAADQFRREVEPELGPRQHSHHHRADGDGRVEGAS